jgi:hypothetical protein
VVKLLGKFAKKMLLGLLVKVSLFYGPSTVARWTEGATGRRGALLVRRRIDLLVRVPRFELGILSVSLVLDQ